MTIRGGLKWLRVTLIRPEELVSPSVSGITRRRVALWFFGALLTVGAATAALQLALLDRAVDSSLQVSLASHVAVMRPGLGRLILVDRLLPPPTIILAVIILGCVSVWSMEIPGSNIKDLLWILALGMTPLLVLRIGEFGAAIIGASTDPSVGEVMLLPRRFVVGPRLFAGSNPAAWVHGLDARANLITFWIGALWIKGLGRFVERDSRFWAPVVVVLSMVVASLVTWSWGGPFLDLILRGW